MSTTWIVVGVLVVIVLIVIVLFNRLVRQRNVVREGWSGIDVQLRRRTDLVPNLIEAVKGYAAHERSVFEEVTQRRAGSIAANDVSGQAAAERALAYPCDRHMADPEVAYFRAVDVAAPAPVAVRSGMRPVTIAAVVIRIGRSRIRAAISIAERRSSPSLSCSSLANSTIRIPCLVIRPTSVSNPTWV